MSAMGDIDEIQQVKYRYLRALDTKHWDEMAATLTEDCLLYTSPSPRDGLLSRMPSSA